MMGLPSRRDRDKRRVAKRAARATEKSMADFKMKTEALGRAVGSNKMSNKTGY